MKTSLHRIYLASVGLAAPGLDGWLKSIPILRGDMSWQYVDMERYKPEMLPPNERRRATDLVRLAFKASEDAIANVDESKRDARMATVFASSGGDYQVTDLLCRALAKPEREVSPTVFHNSVHNAPAGYWGIGTGCQLASTAISAFDASFAMGLLESTMLLHENNIGDEQQTVLLSVYDSKPPYPLDQKRLISLPFASAFVLTNKVSDLQKSLLAIATFDISLEYIEVESKAGITDLEVMRLKNPAARCLPLLELIAKKQAGNLAFTLPGKQKCCVQVGFDV